YVSLYFFFFFQAEDGIRDFHVTGVQTCALPICSKRDIQYASSGFRVVKEQLVKVSHAIEHQLIRVLGFDAQILLHHGGVLIKKRSEERRVGKECRSRWLTSRK